MALDGRGARLYLGQPGNVAALALDQPKLTTARSYAIDGTPNELALAPDGRTLYALDEMQARLWTIDLASGGVQLRTLGAPSGTRYGFLAANADGEHVYALLTRAGRGDQAALWRAGRDGATDGPIILADRPPPWDMALLDTGQLAIARGDGEKGGVELIDTGSLTTTARLDQQRDQHHVAIGPDGALFGLNFTHNTVTRFDTKSGNVIWRTPEDGRFQPWHGAYVPGGWRWPF
jgi:DNA-binding beta-propeller fold protein YncE